MLFVDLDVIRRRVANAIITAPKTAAADMLPWTDIDTVLLDMDGTLLDLHYDNTLWNQALPERYAAARSLSVAAARQTLFARMASVRHTLQFYCLDYWQDATGIDLDQLHDDFAHLVSYRPGTQDFLRTIRRRGLTSVIVTNAHRGSLRVKDAMTQLTAAVDATVSCHDYGYPKEDRRFWEALAGAHPFDPTRTLLVDDNTFVLDAARSFGVAHLVCVARPDSQRPPRNEVDWTTIDALTELL